MNVTRLGLIAVVVSFLCRATYADVYVKVADEWGTIQPAGPRTGNNGIRGWNIEGGGQSNPAFASVGTLRFNMAGLVTQLNTAFPGGWQVNDATLVLEHFDAAFSVAGSVSIFHFTNDTLAITNGAAVAGDPAPSDFTALGVSPLRYSDLAIVDGDAVRVSLDASAPADLGTVNKINDYNFAAQGSGNLDVLGTPAHLVNPAGAINATPDYTLSFPAVNPEDTLDTFNTELASDAGDWSVGGLNTLISDIESGTDALSLLFAATDDASPMAATYNGDPNTAAVRYPPRLYLDVTATTPSGVQGDYNGNGSVDAADYVLWRNGGPLQNDPTAGVQAADYDFWRSRFGASNGGGSGLSGAAVPEPATAMLALLGVAVLRIRRQETI